jgi:hypothetical protein
MNFLPIIDRRTQKECFIDATFVMAKSGGADVGCAGEA